VNSNLLRYLFFFILFLSFVNNTLFRDDHYQEADSVLAFFLLESDPGKVAKYISGTYIGTDADPNSFFQLKDIIRLTPDWALIRLKNFSFFEIAVETYDKDNSYPESADEVRVFINKVFSKRPHTENISVVGVYRIFVSNFFHTLGLNSFITRIIDYPLASTYSFGSAIIYSAIEILTNDYSSFLSSATLFTQALAHLSVLLLFLTLINIRVPPFHSALASILILFSSSLYSYGFHLGSVTYALFAYCLFFWFITVLPINKSYFSRLGIIGGLLIYLNTLMVIPFFGMLLVNFGYIYNNISIRSSKLGLVISSAFQLIRKQKLGLILAFIWLILFFQQYGIKGEMKNISELPSYLYYSFLNLTGWFNQYGELLNIIQIVVFLTIVIIGLHSLRVNKNIFFKDNEVFVYSIFSTLILYLLLIIFGLLNFSPTRHMLFLKVFLVYFYGFGLYQLTFKYIKKDRFYKRFSQFLLIILLGACGLFSQQMRFEQMLDPVKNLSLPKDVAFAISPHPNGFKHVLDIPFKNSRNIDFNDIKDKKILFISQTMSFDEWMDAQDKFQQNNDLIVNQEILLDIPDSYSFMPYRPVEFYDGRFAYDRGNGLYVSKFQVEGSDFD
tara:strand:- start:244 stop:2082 length:1839 start_codon:yes stop_codon:yes gene_type:complete